MRWRSAFLPYIPPRPSTVAEGRTDSESHPAAVAAKAQRSTERSIVSFTSSLRARTEITAGPGPAPAGRRRQPPISKGQNWPRN